MIEQVVSLDRESGTKFVPELSDYDANSPVWQEAEYRSSSFHEEVLTGFWEGEPGWVDFESWPYHETCVILEGLVRIHDSEGGSRTFGAGQAFRVPQGFRGRWETVEPTRKIFIGVTTPN